jgi:hypothetical protein
MTHMDPFLPRLQRVAAGEANFSLLNYPWEGKTSSSLAYSQSLLVVSLYICTYFLSIFQLKE